MKGGDRMRRFDVWVVVEEWDGDDKISEVKTKGER